MADSKSKAKDERSADEIRRDIAATRARLAAGVEGLVEEVHPATLKREATDRARDYVQGEFEQVKGQVKGEHGWRMDRIGVAGGALAAGIVGIIVLRAIVGRATGTTARRKLEKLQLSEAKRVRKEAKQRRKDDAKAAKKNAKLGKKNAKKYGKLDTDDSSVSNLAEKMLKQAAVLRAQAAAEREEGAA
ncbi:MAG: DUF3618 domain-containing protein [Cutibacterium avidum]|uniref:DUF3618 domain-containing protein n=1 Tax=Cutibacterium avidum TaxID=33010 RepID=UPI0003B8DA47|nr:DUF3618 domain-containing protein [Cutibacterium avidum]ERS24914.1 hypothetical protein HMPREF1301_00306 [Propionibacterium sp. KPL2005]ERS29206.1 hypothetical protein HMPREF1297_00015 [Propionibacterium sp. KPL2000]MDU4922261.1 DUF3618 domain-containing protein [Cutibacterium avidum]MDU7388111.1 DUF3618 domain-containing protein [Cutibacterium avidum]MDY0818066.1 DUF3618 domain-containing protein [Cutibacterium avidum]